MAGTVEDDRQFSEFKKNDELAMKSRGVFNVTVRASDIVWLQTIN